MTAAEVLRDLKNFLAWYSAEARPRFSRATVRQYQSGLKSAGFGAGFHQSAAVGHPQASRRSAENGLFDRNVGEASSLPCRRIGGLP